MQRLKMHIIDTYLHIKKLVIHILLIKLLITNESIQDIVYNSFFEHIVLN